MKFRLNRNKALGLMARYDEPWEKYKMQIKRKRARAKKGDR